MNIYLLFVLIAGIAAAFAYIFSFKKNDDTKADSQPIVAPSSEKTEVNQKEKGKSSTLAQDRKGWLEVLIVGENNLIIIDELEKIQGEAKAILEDELEKKIDIDIRLIYLLSKLQRSITYWLDTNQDGKHRVIFDEIKKLWLLGKAELENNATIQDANTKEVLLKWIAGNKMVLQDIMNKCITYYELKNLLDEIVRFLDLNSDFSLEAELLIWKYRYLSAIQYASINRENIIDRLIVLRKNVAQAAEKFSKKYEKTLEKNEFDKWTQYFADLTLKMEEKTVEITALCAEDFTKYDRSDKAFLLYLRIVHKKEEVLAKMEKLFSAIVDASFTSSYKSSILLELKKCSEESVKNCEEKTKLQAQILAFSHKLSFAYGEKLLEEDYKENLLKALEIFEKLKEIFPAANSRYWEMRINLISGQRVTQNELELIGHLKVLCNEIAENSKNEKEISLINQKIIELKFRYAERLRKEGKLSESKMILAEIEAKMPKAQLILLEIHWEEWKNEWEKAKILEEKSRIDALISRLNLLLDGIIAFDKTSKIPLSEYHALRKNIKKMLLDFYYNEAIKAKRSKKFGEAQKKLDTVIRRCEGDFDFQSLKEISFNLMGTLILLEQNELAKIKLTEGLSWEAQGKWKTAQKSYENALAAYKQEPQIASEWTEGKKAGRAKKPSNYKIDYEELKKPAYEYIHILSRIEICKLKLSEKPNADLIMGLKPYFFASKEDLMFRYVIYLIDNKEVKLAKEIILQNWKPTTFSPELQKIFAICQKSYVEKARQKAFEINQILSKNDEKAMWALYQEKEQVLHLFEEGLPHFWEETKEIYLLLYAHIIQQSVDNQRINQLFQLICKDASFLDTPILLQNVGIVCLNLVESQNIEVETYEMIITIWFLMIYSSSVMLNCLKNAKWSKDYQFTFAHYSGARPLRENLSSNLFLNEEGENVYSLKECQTELMRRFEAALNNCQVFFSEKMMAFYGEKKKQPISVHLAHLKEIEKQNKTFKIAPLKVEKLPANPYEMLELNKNANKNEIVKAFQFALRKRKYNANELQAAQRQLLTPTKRLSVDLVIPTKMERITFASLKIEEMESAEINLSEINFNAFDNLQEIVIHYK